MQKKDPSSINRNEPGVFAQTLIMRLDENKEEVRQSIERMTEYNIMNRNKELTDEEAQKIIGEELTKIGDCLSQSFKGRNQRNLARIIGCCTIWFLLTQKYFEIPVSDESKAQTRSPADVDISFSLANSEEHKGPILEPEISKNNSQENVLLIEENFLRLSEGIWSAVMDNWKEISISFGIGLTIYSFVKIILSFSQKEAVLLGSITAILTWISLRTYKLYSAFKRF